MKPRAGAQHRLETSNSGYHADEVSTDRDTEEGLERLRGVVRANPRSTTFVALVHALCDAGREDEAEKVCRAGLGEHPDLVTAQAALGRALAGQGRLEEATRVLVATAEAHPEHGDTFRLLGDIALEQGLAPVARSILEYAEELNPQDGRVAEALRAAGGTPVARSVRPQSDFEHTRVANARALAERMHEDPPDPKRKRSPALPPAATPSEGITPVVEMNGWEPGSVTARRQGPPPMPRDVLARATASRLRTPTPLVRFLVGGTAWHQRGLAFLRGNGLGWRLWGLKLGWSGLARKTRVGLGLGAGLLVMALVLLLWPGGPGGLRGGPGPQSGAAGLDSPARGILAGDFGHLVRMTELTRGVEPLNPKAGDRLALRALATAVLAVDYGLGTLAESVDAAAAAEQPTPPSSKRAASVETARTLVAIAQGQLPEAKSAANRALSAEPHAPESRWAAGRAYLAHGDLDAAEAAFSGALKVAPFAHAVAYDLAALLLDRGKLDESRKVLATALKGRRPTLRERLLLAELARAESRGTGEGEVESACASGAKQSPFLGWRCQIHEAELARLRGERAVSLRGVRAIPHEVAGDRRTARRLGLVLAAFGDIDGAEVYASKGSPKSSGLLSDAWLKVAIDLGRGLGVPGELPRVAPGPEERLLRARAAFAGGGAEALTRTLAEIGPAAVELDRDLQMFAALAKDNQDRRLRAELERRADRGNSLAAYVLGRLAFARGDERRGARHLKHALQGHGDTCEAARLILSLDGKKRPPTVRTPSRLARHLAKRNAACAALASPR